MAFFTKSTNAYLIFLNTYKYRLVITTASGFAIACGYSLKLRYYYVYMSGYTSTNYTPE